MYYCPACGTAYPDSTAECSDCGFELCPDPPQKITSAQVLSQRFSQKHLPPWPKDENGRPEPAKVVCEYPFRQAFISAQMLLSGHGIPVLDGTHNAAGITYTGRYLMEAVLCVPETRHQEALLLLGIE